MWHPRVLFYNWIIGNSVKDLGGAYLSQLKIVQLITGLVTIEVCADCCSKSCLYWLL